MKNTNLNCSSFNITGINIKKIRKEKRITQEELCARMQVMGYQINRSDISKIENGKRFVSDFEIVGFANALKVDIINLFKEN